MPPPKRQRLLPAPTQEARTARRLLFLIPVTVIGAFLLTRLVLATDFASRGIASMIAGELAERTRSSVQLSGVRFTWSFAPCLENLQIYRFRGPYKVKVASEQACIEQWASAVGSGFHAIRIKLDRPSIAFEGNLEDSGADSTPAAAPTTSSTAADRAATLREIKLTFDDLRIDWDRMPFPDRFSSGTFGPIDGSFTLQRRGRKTAANFTIREPATGSRVNGRINPTDDGWDMSAGIEGDVVPIVKPLLAGSGIDLRRMPSNGRVGVNYVSKKRTATIDLDVAQYDVDFESALVSKKRLVGFTAREKMRIAIDIGAGALSVDDGLFEINGIAVPFSIKISPGKSSPAFEVNVSLNTISFVRLLRSVPGASEPVLATDITPAVKFALIFSMSGELKDPSTWAPKLEHRFQGLNDDGAKTGLEFVDGPFEYRPLTKDGRSAEPRMIGPKTPGWVRYKSIPYVQRRAILVSEDSTFFFHNGIEIAEMRAAIQQAMESGERARGGSTVTQQLVKNLFLSRERTALRKVQEMLLTFLVESVLTKEQIFEIYVNIIEFGPDVYGIGNAARHYFGRSVRRLAPKEMGYLASIIPNPPLFHEQHFEKGHVTAKHAGKVNSLLERLNRLGQLPDAQLQTAKEARIRFRRRPKRSKKP